MHPFFSIIIPVFNTVSTLRRCLDSILSQEFGDFEIICVDDGSKDSSKEILLEYTQTDARVRYIGQSNAGPSSARNHGLEEADGEFVMFVDADDCLHDGRALETMHETIMSNDGCELVYFSGEVVFPDIKYSDRMDACVYERATQCLEDNCNCRKCIVFGSVFVQCYKKSVIDHYGIRFNQSVWYGEDRLFVVTFFLYAAKTVVLSDLVYRYIINENSLMRNVEKKERLNSDNMKVAFLIEQQMEALKLELPNLRRYIHGLYVQSMYAMDRKEVNWPFLFRNAVTLRLKVKDLLLYLGINVYVRKGKE